MALYNEDKMEYASVGLERVFELNKNVGNCQKKTALSREFTAPVSIATLTGPNVPKLSSNVVIDHRTDKTFILALDSTVLESLNDVYAPAIPIRFGSDAWLFIVSA